MLQHVGTTRRVAPILARWVPVADTKLKMPWQFVLARDNISQIFPSAYVEIYYGMGVHMHRYILSRTHIMLTIQLHNEFSAPQHHLPMPPTKAMGAITQNLRGHPTVTQ